MKTQTIINIVFAVAFVGYVVSQRNPNVLSQRLNVVSQLNPTFETITCKTWRVVNNDGKERIVANICVDGTAGITWYDKDGKQRIAAETFADGEANVTWRDKDEKKRISASTSANRSSSVSWFDKDEKKRISAGTLADGIVVLPTEDRNPPKKP